MCCDNREQLLDQLNPTFLFTWKGTRLKDEARYHTPRFYRDGIYFVRPRQIQDCGQAL